jgi:hypothetical protein
MHLRLSRVTRNGRTSEYAQLVESYRRPSDGMPTHRVIAHLGVLSPKLIANLRAAIDAERKGKRVVVDRERPVASRAAPLPKILENLRYLDVATLLGLWNEWGLSTLLDEVMPVGDAGVSPASVVAALAIQRCVAPGSKLFAAQWFPRSALPELLSIAPASFNNTRIHRTLDDLDAAGATLMARLPRLYRERDGAFAALFLDVTDAWFVGHGPALAARGKTKEGLIRRKIGIVLLCNEHGYPLRWDVVPGAAPDGKTMTTMVEAIAKLGWVGEAPVVCDRAMGKTAQVRALASTGLRFLTALTVTEFGAYAEGLPHLGRVADADSLETVTGFGMKKVDDTLYVADLGVVERADDTGAPAEDAAPRSAMLVARQITEAVESGQSASFAAAARAFGISKGLAAKYCRLRKLDEDLQRAVLAGEADGCTLSELIALARMRPDEQRTHFRPLATPRRRRATPARIADAPTAFQVRVLAYFNPERFADQRASARRRLEAIQAFVDELNAALASPRARRTRDSIVAAVDRELRSYDLLGAFVLNIVEEKHADRTRFTVTLTLDENDWARRRRYDGFTVLVAHPSVAGTAADLCRLYRAKDIVEKDFQTIKSVVELRPVRHRTDGKVRAHVTLCMLALLLQRTLEQRLGISAEAALEILEPCRLNRLAVGESVLYQLTEPTAEQRDLLRGLKQAHLVDDEATERLVVRQ